MSVTILSNVNGTSMDVDQNHEKIIEKNKQNKRTEKKKKKKKRNIVIKIIIISMIITIFRLNRKKLIRPKLK